MGRSKKNVEISAEAPPAPQEEPKPQKTPIGEEVKEWALKTYEEHTMMLIDFLIVGGAFKRLAFDIFSLSGKGFPFDLEKFTQPQKFDLFYKIYSENWQEFDKDVRFETGYTQKWAMFVKMLALGMTYDEIIKDSKERGYWTPLDQKRKGRW
jgi:hypothetical protein